MNRREFLERAGMAGAAALGAPLLDSGPAAASRRRKRRSPQTPLRHIVVDCQENHSFDSYYGYAPWVRHYGVPHGYSQPDGQGGLVAPHHLTTLSPANPNEGWTGMDLQRQTITALMRSPLWQAAAYIHTYDEHGGYFDHVRPPQLDAYGLGMRVPTYERRRSQRRQAQSARPAA